MALRFHWISVPLAMIIATAYLFYVAQYKPSQKKVKLLQEMDMKVTHKPAECFLQAGRCWWQCVFAATGDRRV
ncbi:hypothetical protein AK812_SmicGene15991 [Symbiodinium microadriaticum]|uniref:Uncharacterized protein n=1 Tax=Symbiodinium microadriaticum TaxID=2951 RepID=A0A1Q9E1K4_SYMMI|nr:hypothetical protein AK812_SmicGene15991 [Symbiodinium microadriaticum]